MGVGVCVGCAGGDRRPTCACACASLPPGGWDETKRHVPRDKEEHACGGWRKRSGRPNRTETTMVEGYRTKRKVHPTVDVEVGADKGEKQDRFSGLRILSIFTSKKSDARKERFRVSSLGAFWWKKVRDNKENLLFENKYKVQNEEQNGLKGMPRDDLLRMRAVEAFHRALYRTAEEKAGNVKSRSSFCTSFRFRSIPTIMPDSRFRTWWDSLVLIVVLMNGVFVPFQIAFAIGSKASWGWLDAIGFLVFSTDIVIQFCTAYIDPQGKVVTDRKKIAKHYIKTWFILDLVGTIPFELFAFIPALEGSGNQVRYLSLLKTPRLLRLGKLMGVLDKLEIANVFHIIRLYFFMLLAVHWLSCIWYPLVRSQGTLYLHADLEDEQETLRMRSAYLLSFYNSLLLMTGEDLDAYSDAERLFCSIALSLGVCFYGFIIGNVMMLLNNMDAMRQFHREKIDVLKRTCTYLGLPASLQSRVGNYFRLLSTRSHPGPDGLQYLAKLPPNLKGDIANFLHLRALKKISLFAQCEEPFLKKLAGALCYELYAAGEPVFSVGDAGRNMFLIVRGSIAVTNKSNETIAVLREGDAFGEAALITSVRRTATCTTINCTDIAVLSAESLNRAMADFPTSAAAIRRVAMDRFSIEEDPCSPTKQSSTGIRGASNRSTSAEMGT